MIKLFINLLAFFYILMFSNFANSTQFISGFEDIPLMTGLTQSENDDFSFGNEETRYIESKLIATRKMKFNDIKFFYEKTLLQLGWSILKNDKKHLILYRENDLLEINLLQSSPLKISIILKNRI